MRRPTLPRALVALALGSSLLAPAAIAEPPSLEIPRLPGAVEVDGVLDEPFYKSTPLVEGFAVAGSPEIKPPATRAWVFWDPEKLVFAYECEEPDLIASEPTGDETDVLPQDRSEVFLWSGKEGSPYYGFEIGAKGAVLDFRAEFPRKVDLTWTPKPWPLAVKPTAKGYIVEGAFPRALLEEMGLSLREKATWRCGLFRGDFHPPGGKRDVDWIAWVDSGRPRADFHIPESFGTFTLAP